jgi:predicted acetyltransferase
MRPPALCSIRSALPQWRWPDDKDPGVTPRGFLSATYKAILFEEEDQVVASALSHPFEKSALYLRQFFVVRGQRRQGHGRKAVRLLFDEIFSPGSRIVVTALSHNKRALTFRAEVGFDEYCVSFERLPRKG